MTTYQAMYSVVALIMLFSAAAFRVCYKINPAEIGLKVISRACLLGMLGVLVNLLARLNGYEDGNSNVNSQTLHTVGSAIIAASIILWLSGALRYFETSEVRPIVLVVFFIAIAMMILARQLFALPTAWTTATVNVVIFTATCVLLVVSLRKQREPAVVMLILGFALVMIASGFRLYTNISALDRTVTSDIDTISMMAVMSGLVLVTFGVILTANVRLVKSLSDLSQRDSLTNILNRRGFIEQVAGGRVLGDGLVMFIDVDYFKAINDEFGHPEGDRLLNNVASHLKSHLPASAIIARFGGDEFAVYMEVSETADVSGLAETIIDQWSPTLPSLLNVSLGLSIGITNIRQNEDLSFALRRADSALYEAKHRGRNRVFCVWDNKRSAA